MRSWDLLRALSAIVVVGEFWRTSDRHCPSSLANGFVLVVVMAATGVCRSVVVNFAREKAQPS